MERQKSSRREFLRAAALSAGGLMLPGASSRAAEKSKGPLVVFSSRFLAGMDAEDMADFVKDIGAGGFDLAVRKSQLVNPGNVARELPRLVGLWKEKGLAVPLITAETTLTNPNAPSAERTWAACAKAEVGAVSIGHWSWRRGASYWELVDKAKKDVAGFAKLSEKHGVRTLVHIQSGNTLTCNASALMALIRDFTPDHVACYLDPAHLAMNGEPLEMALGIIGKHLGMVAVLNYRYMPTVRGGVTKFRRKTCMLHQGLVDWREAVKLIEKIGYEGPYSLLGEYGKHIKIDKLRELATTDAKFLLKALRARGR